ncbi:MAG TPA: NAD(P)/FAD-dependent oxidoreductase [Candidatus Thermoplasmatota archaeon]|nr:NAD(P)/FAD-dependent oxidoreductase [Candidatus Thermoplasmatota archaeon]
MPYDVAIVGAGPAGSTAAKFLAEKGIKTVLIDKSKFPRDKPCGGGLTASIFKTFNYINTEEFIDSFCYGGVVWSKSLNSIRITSTKPVIGTVLRKQFDQKLVEIAQENGAEFVENKKITHIKIKKDGVRLFGDAGFSVSSEVVLGADGVWSTIAKNTGLRPNDSSFGICLYNEIILGEEAIERYFSKERFVHLHLKFEGIPGYGWVFPKKESVNLGVGVIDAVIFKKKYMIDLKVVFTKYLWTLKKAGLLPQDLSLGVVKGGALPSHPLRKMYTNRVLLCGDAAGLINPLTGEGIDYAMNSGKIAADLVVEAVQNEETNEKFLSKYQTRIHHQFGKDIDLFLKGSKQWYKGNEKFFSLIQNDKEMAEMFLQIITGNECISTIKWKLLRRFLSQRLKEFFK